MGIGWPTRRRHLTTALAAALTLALTLTFAAATPAAAHPTQTDPPPTQTIILAGDSITAGWLLQPADRLDTRLSYRLCGRVCTTMTITNKGIGGQRLVGATPGTNLVDTLPPVIATMRPGDILAIDIGMNDLFAYPGDFAWTTAYVSLTDQALARGVHIIPCQITPVTSDHWNIELLRQRLNQWLTDRYGTWTVRYPDRLNTGGTWLNPQMAEPDGIHPNEYGTMRMADMLTDHLITQGWLNPLTPGAAFSRSRRAGR
jgi:lysophospholipase L1-like esterase